MSDFVTWLLAAAGGKWGKRDSTLLGCSKGTFCSYNLILSPVNAFFKIK